MRFCLNGELDPSPKKLPYGALVAAGRRAAARGADAPSQVARRAAAPRIGRIQIMQITRDALVDALPVHVAG